MSFQNKIVLIAGGSSGTGLSTAQAFAHTFVLGLEMKASAVCARPLGDWQFDVLDWLVARVRKSAGSGGAAQKNP